MPTADVFSAMLTDAGRLNTGDLLTDTMISCETVSVPSETEIVSEYML